jgi:hypothetical protein
MSIVLPLPEEVDQGAEFECRGDNSKDDRGAKVPASLSLVFLHAVVMLTQRNEILSS